MHIRDLIFILVDGQSSFMAHAQFIYIQYGITDIFSRGRHTNGLVLAKITLVKKPRVYKEWTVYILHGFSRIH